MSICEECFESNVISNYIEEMGTKLGTISICDNCEKESEYRIEEYILKEKVQRVILRHYVHDNEHGLVTSAIMMARDEDDDISTFISGTNSLKTICYELFGIDTISDKFYELLEDNSQDDISPFDDDPDFENWMNIGCDWDGTDQVMLDWSTFSENVKHKARFFDHKEYSRIDELSRLDETFKTLSNKITKTLYRARKVNTIEKKTSLKKNPKKELGIAPKENAGHNRFSPLGIPYVYLSSDDETILKEIRAKKNDVVGIGIFSINDLNLIDLRKGNLSFIRNNPFLDSCTAQILCSFKTINGFLSDISKEVKSEDSKLDYIPTQLVSEYIWSLGYDGFIFDSSLCKGDNYVLFEDNYSFQNYSIKTL